MKKRNNSMKDELRPEYDLRLLLKGGVRGKYARRYQAGTNLVLLDPDVRRAFRREKAVNDVLRLVIELRKPDGSLPRFYQVVLKVKSMDDMPLEISYVMHRELSGKAVR